MSNRFNNAQRQPNEPAARLRRRPRRDAGRDGRRAARCSTTSTPDDAEHFAEVRALLDGAGVDYEVDPTLVRGLDYYTRTVFEFESDAARRAGGVGGGGRYDGLVEELGGPATPGVGWAAGIERILLAREANLAASRSRSTSRSPTGRARATAFALAVALREAGVRTELEQAGRSLKGQLKHADRIGARGRRDRRRRDRVEGHGDGRAAHRGEHRGGGRDRRGGGRMSTPTFDNRYRTAWAGELRAARAGERGAALPAGSTAAATTAG